MPGKIHQIVYELGGFPKGLSEEADWRNAIRSGELTPATVVDVYRDFETRPVSQLAGDVLELGPLFDPPEAPPGEEERTEPVEAPRPPPEEPKAEAESEDESGIWTDGEHQSESVAQVEPGGETPRPPWAPVVAGIGGAMLLLAGLGFWTIADRSHPARDLEEQPKLYRVIAPANLRRAASLKGELVRTLRRNQTLVATLDEKTKGVWLRVADGEYEGLFIWRENLEIVNLTQEQIANSN